MLEKEKSAERWQTGERNSETTTRVSKESKRWGAKWVWREEVREARLKGGGGRRRRAVFKERCVYSTD